MNKIYLTTRLYNLDDKLRTCKLEKYLEENFDVSIYMPYRDSDEENISAENWKEDIFAMDIKAIDECDTLIGYLDGPEFDEGIGFEIGYAITKQKSIHIINSDFISYSIDDNATKIIDPILNDFKINIITTENETINNNNFCDSLSELSQKLLEKITFSKITAFAEVKKKPFKYDYFIERGNSKIFNFLTKNQNGSNRLKTFDSTDDLDKLLASKKVYILANGTEMHFGSAIIAGICYGLEIPFYIVDDRMNYLVGHNEITMKTNLMIDVASSGYVDIVEFLDAL